MKHTWSEAEGERLIEYNWRKGSDWHTFSVKAKEQATEIQPGSETEFITEHYWGYAKVSDSKTNEYEVTHPRWDVYDVLDYTIDVDFGDVYGAEFSFLNERAPVSVMLAEGSEITVENKKKIKKRPAAKAIAH